MEDAFKLISNAPEKGVAPNYFHILPPTRKCENPTKTWKL
jgi:hypothetical protein